MILTVNIGNTHITVGGYEQDTLIFCGRLHSDPAATVEEYAIRLVNLLQLGMDVTLHRAFDMTRDPMETLEKAIELGCKTILTSGQQSDVVAGKDLLKDVYAAAAGRIDIMAGCGVKKWNIQEVHDHTGIVVFHTTGRKGALDSGMKYRKSTVAMGLPTLSEYEIWETDEQEFRECAQIVHSFGK